MDTPEIVPASEFTRNFGRYRMRARRAAIAVSSHGRVTGYFVDPDEYEEFRRFREWLGASFARLDMRNSRKLRRPRGWRLTVSLPANSRSTP